MYRFYFEDYEHDWSDTSEVSCTEGVSDAIAR